MKQPVLIVIAAALGFSAGLCLAPKGRGLIVLGEDGHIVLGSGHTQVRGVDFFYRGWGSFMLARGSTRISQCNIRTDKPTPPRQFLPSQIESNNIPVVRCDADWWQLKEAIARLRPGYRLIIDSYGNGCPFEPMDISIPEKGVKL